MAQNDFTITIKDDSVEVRLTPSAHSPRAKLGGVIFSSCMTVLGPVVLLFLPGKHGNPSMWHDVSNAELGSSDFIVPISMLIVGFIFLGWLTFRWSRAAWPSDETFHCDSTTLTITRVPYLDFRNRTWKTKSYPLHDIQKLRFAVYASAKGSSMYGLRFRTYDGRNKVLPGLEAPEAQNILVALQRLGADVIIDDKLQKKVNEALEKRGNQLSLGL